MLLKCQVYLYLKKMKTNDKYLICLATGIDAHV